MDRYFTFFLYGKRPSATPAVLEFVDWLTGATSGKDKLHVIARDSRLEEGSTQPTQGSFLDCRRELDGRSLSALNVSSLNRTSAGAEIFFRYESGPEGPKTITFSLRSDLWMKCERDGITTQVLEATERLFVSQDCVYGYGNPSHYVIPGRFSLIRGNLQAGAPRIADFDYDRYVEDIYRYNYLGQPLALKIDESRLRGQNGIVLTEMFNQAGSRSGIAIYVSTDSPDVIACVAESLQPVLWSEQMRLLAVPGRKS